MPLTTGSICSLKKGGVSKTLRPCALLTGQSWSYTTDCKLEFGDYIQTHEEHDNSMAARIMGEMPYALPETDRVAISFIALLPGEC